MSTTLGGVSRAQRSTKWCAADPGSLQSVAVPDQRCNATPRSALHRIRDTIVNNAFRRPRSSLSLLHRNLPRVEGHIP